MPVISPEFRICALEGRVAVGFGFLDAVGTERMDQHLCLFTTTSCFSVPSCGELVGVVEQLPSHYRRMGESSRLLWSESGGRNIGRLG